MTDRGEYLPRPAAELERLVDHYASHDTGTEMEHGSRTEPQLMATTSLRLSAEVDSQFKLQGWARHVRYTAYLRSNLERVAAGFRRRKSPTSLSAWKGSSEP